MNYNEAEDFLAHYGKRGMKWGQRMSRLDQKVFTPSRAKAVGLGMIGKEKYYKNAEAKSLRAKAGKQLYTSTILSVGAMAVSSLTRSRNQSVAIGASVAGLLLNGASVATGVVGTKNAYQAVFKETAKSKNN